MRTSAYLGWRFLRARRLDVAISTVAWLSLGGVILGVAALLVTIAVLSGFRENLFRAVVATTPHAQWRSALEAGFTEGETQRLLEYARDLPAVEHATPRLIEQVFLAEGSGFRPLQLQGIDPASEAQVSGLAGLVYGQQAPSPSASAGRGVVDGEATATEALAGFLAKLPRASTGDSAADHASRRPGILLGESLVQRLGLRHGDAIRLVSQAQRPTPFGPLPSLQVFTLVGSYHTGILGNDERIGYVDRPEAQKLLRRSRPANSVALKLRAPRDITSETLGASDIVSQAQLSTWSDTNKALFQVMRLEKICVFVILTLMILIGFFNIIASMVMLVLEKRHAIATLKSLGGTDALIYRIFLHQGMWIGVVGTSGGMGLGLLLCLVLPYLPWIQIPAGVFPLSGGLPVDVQPDDLLLIAAASMGVCLSMTLYPARQAARVANHPFLAQQLGRFYVRWRRDEGR